MYMTTPFKEEQPCVEVGPPWLNKVKSESDTLCDGGICHSGESG